MKKDTTKVPCVDSIPGRGILFLAKKIHSFAAGFSEGFLPEFPDEVTAVYRLACDLLTGRTSDCEGWLESVTDALYLDCKDSLYAYELLQEVRKQKRKER